MGFVKKLIFSVVTLFRKNKLDRIQKEIEKQKLVKKIRKRPWNSYENFPRENLSIYIYI